MKLTTRWFRLTAVGAACVLLHGQYGSAQFGPIGNIRNPFNNKPIGEQVGDGRGGPKIFPAVPRESSSEVAVVSPPEIDPNSGRIYSGSGSGGRRGDPVGWATLGKRNDGFYWWATNYRNIYGGARDVRASNSIQIAERNKEFQRQQQQQNAMQQQQQQQQWNLINQQQAQHQYQQQVAQRQAQQQALLAAKRLSGNRFPP